MANPIEPEQQVVAQPSAPQEQRAAQKIDDKSVFTLRHDGHVGAPKQRNGSHVCVPI